MQPYNDQAQMGHQLGQVVVQTQQIQPMHIDVVMEPWSWCTLITAIIGYCCCPLFGLIASVMAAMSYVDHRNKDVEMYRSKKSCSLGFGIAAIVIGSILLLIGIIILVVMPSVLLSSLAGHMQQSKSRYP